MEAIDPYWIEAPVPERDLEGWRRVRDSTSARLAGGEFLVGLEAHRRFIEATGVDVVMPDVKYCGGIGGLAQVTALAASFGTEVAPHDPSGPVATAATAHAALASATPQIVEFAWGETSWRSELVGGRETVEGGRIWLDGRPGLGVALDEAFAAGHPFEETPVSADLWERSIHRRHRSGRATPILADSGASIGFRTWPVISRWSPNGPPLVSDVDSAEGIATRRSRA